MGGGRRVDAAIDAWPVVLTEATYFGASVVVSFVFCDALIRHTPSSRMYTRVKIPVLGCRDVPSGSDSPLMLHVTWAIATSVLRSSTSTRVVSHTLSAI